MAEPSTTALRRALAGLSPLDRKLLEGSLREGLSDRELADRAGGDPDEISWRRVELINQVAGEVGATSPNDLLAVSGRLEELSAEDWVVPPPASPPAPTGGGPPAGGEVAWRRAQQWGVGLLLAMPALLTAYCGFNAGGYFPDTIGVLAAALLLVLVVRVTCAEDPFEGVSLAVGVAVAAVGLFAVWTLLSGGRSDAPARALVEFDRVLLYLGIVVVVGSLRHTPARMRWMVRGVALAILVVCAAGLITRVLPDVWPAPVDLQDDRLSYPLTYWNGLGLFAALGIVLALHLAADQREPWWSRALGAAALPLLGTVLLLTFSRGGIAVAAGAVVVYVVLARPRLLGSALLAAGPPFAFAIAQAYDADLVASTRYTSGAALDQGHDLALVAALCCVAAFGLRVALLPVDRRLAAIQLGDRLPRHAPAALAGAAAVAVLVVALAAGAPGYAEGQYDRFVSTSVVDERGATRDRLSSAANNGRLEFWRIARDTYRERPVVGVGAGTYELAWLEHRPYDLDIVDAHSLFIEVLAELGLVGLALLAVFLLALLVGAALRCRGPDRGIYAVTVAVLAAWLVHAGVDWDWELPAVTVPGFALGAYAIAGSGAGGFGRPGRLARVVVGLGLAFVAITPVRIVLSQERLEDASQALRHGDCATATSKALSAQSAVATRPEPFEILGYCDARSAGLGSLSVKMMQRAVNRDPHNWEPYYGLALARGAVRRDPRPAARRAYRLNPRGALTRSALRRFNTRDPARWERAARASRLPFKRR